jgi:hypothetical protein
MFLSSLSLSVGKSWYFKNTGANSTIFESETVVLQRCSSRLERFFKVDENILLSNRTTWDPLGILNFYNAGVVNFYNSGIVTHDCM